MGKVEPRKLLVIGLCVASISLILLGNLNLQAGYWDIFWPQMLQGAAMGLLFVPLTTITNNPIPNEQIGNATSIFNLMRNIGASIGIASVTTIVARNGQTNINSMVGNLTPYDPTMQSALASAKAMFLARGMDGVTATQQAYAAIYGQLQQQASMMSFIDAFRFLGFMFLLMVPLVLIMKKPKGGGGAPMAH
jgi:DHA2 family multidrug resistance protein